MPLPVGAVGASGTVIKTTDAGQTWTAMIIGPDELRAIYAIDANTAWAVGSSGAIYATTDGGGDVESTGNTDR